MKNEKSEMDDQHRQLIKLGLDGATLFTPGLWALLRLVPDDGALVKLAADYQHMVDDGLFLDDAEPFDALLRRCGAIELKANMP